MGHKRLRIVAADCTRWVEKIQSDFALPLNCGEFRSPAVYCVGEYHPRRDRTRRFFRSLATISMVR